MHGVVGGNSKIQIPKYTREQVGFVKRNQLVFNGMWLLKRISPICEGCSSSRGYEVFKDTYSQIMSKTIHYILSCVECEWSLELEYEEYHKIKKMVKLNQKYNVGELSESEYINKLDKEIEKIMKHMPK